MAIKSRQIAAVFLEGQKETVSFVSFPDECPICHTSVIPKHLTSAFTTSKNIIQATYQCSNQKCQRLFFATYHRDNNTGYYSHTSVEPIVAKKEVFSEEIFSPSTSFVTIYNQALAAESMNLHEVVGIALRKAIEFLVKDYAIAKNPAASDDIKREQLGKCIESYIDDSKIEKCFKRATWLGNDETHYSRLWADKDINDLKSLIRISVNGLENLLLA